MPISGWLRSELREYVHDALLARDSACARFFDRQAVEEIVNRYERNRFSEYQAVWSLLVFEFWHKRFIEDFVSANVGEERPVEIDVASGHGA